MSIASWIVVVAVFDPNGFFKLGQLILKDEEVNSSLGDCLRNQQH